MLVKDVVLKSAEFLKAKGSESPRLDAELLVGQVLGLSRVEIYLKYDQPLSENDIKSCREMIVRRGTGEPVAYIKGEKEFFGRLFAVDKRVLIPRSETEELVGHALTWARNQEKVRILDFGCGSGCIGQSLLLELAQSGHEAHLIAVDTSGPAIEVARANAERHGLKDKIEFIQCDAGRTDFSQVDLIVANPPYIAADDPSVQKSVRDFEPHGALFSPDQGLMAFKEWSKNAASCLRPQGFMIFEIGRTQAEATKEFLAQQGSWKQIQIHDDISGSSRFISAIRQH